MDRQKDGNNTICSPTIYLRSIKENIIYAPIILDFRGFKISKCMNYYQARNRCTRSFTEIFFCILKICRPIVKLGILYHILWVAAIRCRVGLDSWHTRRPPVGVAHQIFRHKLLSRIHDTSRGMGHKGITRWTWEQLTLYENSYTGSHYGVHKGEWCHR